MLAFRQGSDNVARPPRKPARLPSAREADGDSVAGRRYIKSLHDFIFVPVCWSDPLLQPSAAESIFRGRVEGDRSNGRSIPVGHLGW